MRVDARMLRASHLLRLDVATQTVMGTDGSNVMVGVFVMSVKNGSRQLTRAREKGQKEDLIHRYDR